MKLAGDLWEVWYDNGPRTPAVPVYVPKYEPATRLTFLDLVDAEDYAARCEDEARGHRRYRAKRKVS